LELIRALTKHNIANLPVFDAVVVYHFIKDNGHTIPYLPPMKNMLMFKCKSLFVHIMTKVQQ
jgi:hypothetical protein